MNDAMGPVIFEIHLSTYDYDWKIGLTSIANRQTVSEFPYKINGKLY